MPIDRIETVAPFHELEASSEVRLYPTRDVAQFFGHHPSVRAKSFVNRGSSSVVKMFNHHLEHIYLFGCQDSILYILWNDLPVELV